MSWPNHIVIIAALGACLACSAAKTQSFDGGFEDATLADSAEPIDGPQTAQCGDLICGADECLSCPGDCSGCVCGDGTCQPGELCSTCVLDCGTCAPTCGDDVCDAPDESCETCPDDCVTGCSDPCDGQCSGPAECATCPADCPGVCDGPPCGNGFCEPELGECYLGCTDCDGLCFCGDDLCDRRSGECTTCDADCTGEPICDPCGDAVCDLTSECSSCAQDCADEPLCSCGDGTCDTDIENCASCAADCTCTCDNNVCEIGECGPNGDCPADCPGGCPSCAHDVCQLGDPLALDCDACVAQVCAARASCCVTAWDATCITKAQLLCAAPCLL